MCPPLEAPTTSTLPSDELPSDELPWMPVAPGDVLDGKYHVEGVIGRGGMSIVVSAWHDVLDQRVAIKLLLPEVLRRAGAIERFLREARSAAKIRSQHVARVFDVGTTDRGVPFLVMEHLSGSDLHRILRDEGRLAPRVAAMYVLQASSAIAEAHRLGIVHRDLKPANLFVAAAADGKPLVKVLDFGLSKALEGVDSPQSELTRSGVMMGTPLYMSPEQLLSAHHVDRRTDIWALGVILYRALTGATPFHGETIAALALSVVNDEAPPFGAQCAGVPRGLESVVRRCLAKNPADRFQNVRALTAALEPFASAGTHAAEAGVASLAPSHTAASERIDVRGSRWGRRGLVVGGVVALVVSAGSFAAMRTTKSAPSTMAVSTEAHASPAEPAPAEATASAELPNDLPAEALAPTGTAASPGTKPTRSSASPTGSPAQASHPTAKGRKQRDYGF